MPDVLDVMQAVAHAATVDEVWDHAVRYFKGHGLSRATYGFTRFRRERSVGDPDDLLFVSSYPADYSRLYFQGGLYAKTAMFRWVTQNTGTCTWRWVEEAAQRGELSPQEIEAMKVNRAAGVLAGVSISFPEVSARAKGALGLAADPGIGHDEMDVLWAAWGKEIETLAHMMHLKIVQLPMANRRRQLTERQREVLEWVADGKTAQDIGVIMGISPAMVEKHLRLARQALDVETTAQAVAKGTMLNRIFQRPAHAGVGLRLAG